MPNNEAEGPVTITMPPWLVQMLPTISGAELKIILAGMFDTGRPGHRQDAPMPTAAHLAKTTGLSRRAVIDARQSATEKGLLVKRGKKRQATYVLSLDGFNPDGAISAPNVCMYVLPSLSEEQQHTMVQILHLGVARPVALDLIRRYDTPYLLQHLQYAQEAQDANVAYNAPGWFICSVEENRPRPLFRNSSKQDSPTWYEEYKDFVTK